MDVFLGAEPPNPLIWMSADRVPSSLALPVRPLPTPTPPLGEREGSGDRGDAGREDGSTDIVGSEIVGSDIGGAIASLDALGRSGALRGLGRFGGLAGATGECGLGPSSSRSRP